MEIKQLEPKEKVLTFFGEFKSATVESAIKEIVKINISDQEYLKQCQQWAIDNGQDPSPAKLTPIEFYLSTYGGACYDGLALHDVLESSNTPVEVICTGKIMSMGVIVALGAKVRKAYRNTTFMIHQVSGLSFGTLREMEDTVAEASRINEILFNIRNACPVNEADITFSRIFFREYHVARVALFHLFLERETEKAQTFNKAAVSSCYTLA